MRQPDWDVDRVRGEEGEQLVRILRRRILSSQTEVKVDDRARETGNLYVEYQCRRADGDWYPSGIATTKALTYVFIVDPLLVAMPTWVLRNLARGLREAGKVGNCTVGSHPTRGVLLPLDDLRSSAWSIWNAPTTEQPLAASWEQSLPTAAQAREYSKTGMFAPDPEGWAA